MIELLKALADDQLILGHRLSELCGHGPVLEEDIAMINISLDKLGQAKTLYEQLAKLEGGEKTEDYYPFQRTDRQFRNALLVEQPNGHFGDVIVRQFLFDTYMVLLLEELQNSKEDFLKAFADKAIKEVKYHERFAKNWLLRLGDGTEESNQKVQGSLDRLWRFSLEFFTTESFSQIVDLDALKVQWLARIQEVISEATLFMPEKRDWTMKGGREGIHTEHLGFILADMQYLQRVYPNAEW